MKRGGLFGNSMRLAAAVATGALVLAAGPAHAGDPLAKAKACRKTITGEMAKLSKLINVLVDKCSKTQVKGNLSRANCYVADSAEMDPPKPPSFPTGKYDLYKQKAHDKIALKCDGGLGGADVGNYQSGDAFARLLPIVEAETLAASKASHGDDTIDGTSKADADKAKAKCAGTVAKWHSKLWYEVLKDSNKAQLLLDKTATTTATAFGRISEASLDSGDLSTPLASAAINTDCGSVSGIDTCLNGTTCLDATRSAAQKLTRELYHGKNVCEPFIGTRTVEITITTPENLAGMKVDLDYPQFATGLVGTEQAELVADRVSLTHTDPAMFKVVNDRESDMSVVVGATNAFIQTGDKVTISFDSCLAKETNMCNRTQQVVGCDIPVPPFNDNPAVCTFPGPSDTYPDGLINGVPGGCCPGDNACFPQSLSTTCSVTDPVRADGSNVAGVTCSVSISGT